MISAWLAIAPMVLATLVLVLVPGLLIARAFDLRGLAGLAIAPPVSVAVIASTAIVLGWFGIPWSLLSAAIAIAVVIGAARGLRALTRPAAGPTEPATNSGGADQRSTPTSSRAAAERWVLPAGLVLGMAFGIWRLASYIGDPAGISQTNDAVFHMNAVQYILDTADASSMHVSSMIGGVGFYPAAWHDVVSLLVQFTGSSIPIAANAFTVVIGAVIWTLGLSWFALTLTGSNTVAAVTAILSGALQLFPLLMFQWGVLFPNALSTAMLPAVAASMMMILASWRLASGGLRSWLRVIVLVGAGAVAIALAQPATLPILGLVVAVWLTDRLIREAPQGHRLRGVALAVGVWLVLAVLWFALSQGTGGSHWPPFRGKAEVLLDVLTNGQMRIERAYGVSALMVVGLVAVWRRRSTRWFAFVWLAISLLYMLVAAVGMPLVRNVLMGAWYADPYRISAYAPLAVIPLAAIGVDFLARLVVGIVTRRRSAPRALRPTLSMAAAVLLMTGIVLVRPVPMPEFIENTFDAGSRYVITDDTYLDTDERVLLSELSRYVEPGARVLGNPGTGTGFGYMLSGVDVFPRTWSPPRTAQWQVLAQSLNDAASNPSVCKALQSLGDPEYVLDFGLGEDAPGRFIMPGMTDFDDKPGFEFVAHRGDASLWRITACSL